MVSSLLSVFKAALRRGGITQLPGTTPSPDQTTELIPEINRMLSSASLDGHKIYTTSIERYRMSPLQTQYFIGPTGDFVAPRPLQIVRANIVLLNSDPELHLPMYLADDEEWAAMVITELQMNWPYILYNDGANPDSLLYLYGTPTDINDLELYTWLALKTDFTSVTDDVIFPDGYEAWIIDELALIVNKLYPYDSKLTAIQISELKDSARRTREAVKILNTRSPKYANEAAGLGNSGPAGDLRSAFYAFGNNVNR